MTTLIKREEFQENWEAYIFALNNEKKFQGRYGEGSRLYTSSINIHSCHTGIQWQDYPRMEAKDEPRKVFIDLPVEAQDAILACINIICGLDWRFEN